MRLHICTLHNNLTPVSNHKKISQHTIIDTTLHLRWLHFLKFQPQKKREEEWEGVSSIPLTARPWPYHTGSIIRVQAQSKVTLKSPSQITHVCFAWADDKLKPQNKNKNMGEKSTGSRVNTHPTTALNDHKLKPMDHTGGQDLFNSVFNPQCFTADCFLGIFEFTAGVWWVAAQRPVGGRSRLNWLDETRWPLWSRPAVQC